VAGAGASVPEQVGSYAPETNAVMERLERSWKPLLFSGASG
jgi:hypothetical protein